MPIPVRLVVEHQGKHEMKALGVTSFRKTAACPSESLLVSYKCEKLSRKNMTLVESHLVTCDFCSAEMPLLSFYAQPRRGECKAPDIPMNLRILAESLLRRRRKRSAVIH